jgi:hypothetical protein
MAREPPRDTARSSRRIGSPPCPLPLRRAPGEEPMVLRVWCFECQRCKRRVLLCTRCLRRRRYCPVCAAEVRRGRQRKAGRKYQQTDKGRRRHRQRSRRYRRGQRGPRLAGCSESAAPPESGGTETEPAESPHPPCVTHQSSRPESRLSARVEPAPTVAALRVASARGAEEPSRAEPRAKQSAAASSEGECKREVSSERAAALLAASRWPQRPEAQPTLVRCSCCGRVGELVFFEERLAVMRGRGPG